MVSSMIVLNQIGECLVKEYKNIREQELDKENKVEKFKKVKTKSLLQAQILQFSVTWKNINFICLDLFLN